KSACKLFCQSMSYFLTVASQLPARRRRLDEEEIQANPSVTRGHRIGKSSADKLLRLQKQRKYPCAFPQGLWEDDIDEIEWFCKKFSLARRISANSDNCHFNIARVRYQRGRSGN